METKMPVTVEEAILEKIKEKGGQITVMPGERFEKNLAVAVGLDGVNTREVLKAVRRLVDGGRLVQHRVVEGEELPTGVVREGNIRQCIYRLP